MRCPCPCVVAACLLIVFLWTGACSDAAGPAFLGSALAGEPCVTDLDCDDDNPCTYTYCLAGTCHSDWSPGCCWAPEDANPKTGLPWLDGAERQAFADSPCDDGDYCTEIDECDLATNECHSTLPIPGCCNIDEDCWAPAAKFCEVHACVSHKCVVEPPYEECCPMPGDPGYDPAVDAPAIACDDDNFCTDDYCNDHKCIHLQTFCCVDDPSCQLYFDDGDPCTIEKCVFDPDIGSSACEPFYQMLCSAELPYRKSFDGAKHHCGPPLVPGWSISDSGNDATKNWCVVSKGALGPDEHLRFLWYPTTAAARSAAVTPLIDASSSGTSAFNPELATTVQWRMAYRHSVPGEPVTLSVVMTDDGDFADGNVVWQQTVTDDIEYNLYSFQLDNSLKFANDLQVGFMVDTGSASTFNMDAWEIDDLLVAEGVPNTLARARLFRCETDSCSLATGAVLVTESTTEVPELTMVVNEHYKYVLCYQDPDFNQQQAQYWGRPHAYLDGSPLDKPGFVVPADMTGFGSSCFFIPAGVDAMCGQGVANYFCIIDVDPAADPANVGEYRIGIVGQDEWKADPTGYNHSPFQSLNKADLRVLPDPGYLVWSPLGKDRFAAQAMMAAIEAAGRPAYVVEDILMVPDLSPYDGVFATLGVKGYARDPTQEEASALDHYLDGGGRLYLEGGDYWYRGPGEQGDATLFPYFGVDGLWGGSKALEGQITGTGYLDGTGFDYDAGPYCAFYNEGLEPAQQSGAVEFMSHAGEPAFPVVVANESGKWRVIGSSVLFGCLKEKDLGTTDHLMHQYLYYLINGLP